jgi:hypothetical protein
MLCEYQFCYICLAPWKVIMLEGNTAHAPDCKYHSDRLNANDDGVDIDPVALLLRQDLEQEQAAEYLPEQEEEISQDDWEIFDDSS